VQQKVPVIVIMEETAGVAAHAAETLFGLAASELKASWSRIFNGFAADLTLRQIRALEAHPGVSRIEYDETAYALCANATYWAGVQAAWNDFGVNGSSGGDPGSSGAGDVVVAVLDTGIDNGHADLAGEKIVGWHDAVNGRPLPYDDNGHGTHVAGIVAGTGAGDPSCKGVAWGAALVGIKVLGAGGSGPTSQVISGVEWMMDNKDRYNIRVANLSLGSSRPSSGRDALSRAVNAAADAGIAVCVAAGNSGPRPRTVGSPGAAEKAITVGAVYDPSDNGWVLAPFSSRGPTADGRTKPDVCAPGVNIRAPLAGSRDRYVAMSGTSMAAPFAAGVVALMLSANPEMTLADVKAVLYSASCVKDFGPPGKDPDFGHGILRCYDAVSMARAMRVTGAGEAARAEAPGAATGGWTDGLTHVYRTGTLRRRRASAAHALTVTNAGLPVGITFVIQNWSRSRDFDIHLRDPNGHIIASSVGTSRQEHILAKPAIPGTYSLQVVADRGTGSYWLSASLA